MWELLNDVINVKFPNLQKNMAVLFNNFYKDVDKEQTQASGSRRDADGDKRGGGRRQRFDEDESFIAEPHANDVNSEHRFDGGVEEGEGLPTSLEEV